MDRWTRVRVVFGKSGRLRFLGQLDLGRTLERALRRTRLDLRYSEGFNPRLRLSFPCASPTGMASRCEIVEVQAAPPAGAAEVAAALREALPPELPVMAAEDVPEGEVLRLLAARYAITRKEDGPELPSAASVTALTAQESIPVDRRGRSIDLKPLLADLRREDDRIAVRIRFLESGATARPEDLLRALGADPLAYALERTGMTVRCGRAGKEIEREHGS